MFEFITNNILGTGSHSEVRAVETVHVTMNGEQPIGFKIKARREEDQLFGLLQDMDKVEGKISATQASDRFNTIFNDEVMSHNNNNNNNNNSNISCALSYDRLT